MFFTVKGKTNTVYLMGSIHIGKNSFYPFPERIEKAFSNTNNIVVEFNPNSKENVGEVRNISSYGYLEDNKTLKDVLSKDLYKALETNLSNYNIPIDKMGPSEAMAGGIFFGNVKDDVFRICSRQWNRKVFFRESK
jgi:uncharacterized protein